MFAMFVTLGLSALGCGGSADEVDTRRVSSGEDRTEGQDPSDDQGTVEDAVRAPNGDPSSDDQAFVENGTLPPYRSGADAPADGQDSGGDQPTDPEQDPNTTPGDDEDVETPSEPNQPSEPAEPSDPGTSTPTPGNSGSANPLAFLNRSDTRAMWVWSESPSAQQLIENTGGAQDTLMQFASAPHGDANRSLNRLFFEARGHSNTDRWAQARTVTYDPITDASKQAQLRAFLKRAHAQGMDVEYLDGQAIWVATDFLAEVPKQICRDIVAFNKTTSDVTERFDGAHFDIEPHTVREGPYAGLWWQNKLPNGYNAEWTQRWKDIMNSCRATFDAYHAETGHRLVLASDVGADYAYYNKPILDFFNGPNSPIDYIGIMNYYDNRPNQNGQPSFFWGESDGGTVTGGVEQNLGFWTNLPVLFGVETGPTSIAPDYMSFYQEGYTALNAVMDQLETSYSSTNSMGIAIHHYSPGSYKDLQP